MEYQNVFFKLQLLIKAIERERKRLLTNKTHKAERQWGEAMATGQRRGQWQQARGEAVKLEREWSGQQLQHNRTKLHLYYTLLWIVKQHASVFQRYVAVVQQLAVNFCFTTLA